MSRDTPWPGTPVSAEDFLFTTGRCVCVCFCNTSNVVLLRLTTLFMTDTRPFTTDEFLVVCKGEGCRKEGRRGQALDKIRACTVLHS